MRSPVTQCAVRARSRVLNERVQDQVSAEVELLQQDLVFLGTEAPHPVDPGCGCLGEAFVGRFGGVDSVHTLGRGLGRTGAGLARIPHVSAGSQCLQELESGSSPTSGTVLPQVRGLFRCFFVCTLCTLSALI